MLLLDFFWFYFSFILRYLLDYFVIGSKKLKRIWGPCRVGLSMSFSSLIFASRSISDDMIFCAGWAEVP